MDLVEWRVVVGLLVDLVEVGYAETAADLAQPKGGLLRPLIEHLVGARRRSICLPGIMSCRSKQDGNGSTT